MAFFRKKTAAGKELTAADILAKVEHFCVWRERFPREVTDKIRELGLRGEAADRLFDLLKEENFFNETRFALAYASGKFRINHWGKVRLRLELRAAGIAPALIQAALDSISEPEYLAVLQKLMDKKRAQLADEPPEARRQKTAASLIRAGYEPELVFQNLNIG